MGDMEDLIISFMMEFFVQMIPEHTATHRPCKIRSMHNSNLQENAWISEILA